MEKRRMQNGKWKKLVKRSQKKLVAVTLAGAMFGSAIAPLTVSAWTARTPEQIANDLGSVESIEDLSTYNLRYGDTLWGMSQATGYSVTDIANQYGIPDASYIVAGRTLTDDHVRSGSSQTSPDTYTVSPGDTLSNIARAFGVTVEQLALWNNIENVDLIFPGQTFRLNETAGIPGGAVNNVSETETTQDTTSESNQTENTSPDDGDTGNFGAVENDKTDTDTQDDSDEEVVVEDEDDTGNSGEIGDKNDDVVDNNDEETPVEEDEDEAQIEDEEPVIEDSEGDETPIEDETEEEAPVEEETPEVPVDEDEPAEEEKETPEEDKTPDTPEEDEEPVEEPEVPVEDEESEIPVEDEETVEEDSTSDNTPEKDEDTENNQDAYEVVDVTTGTVEKVIPYETEYVYRDDLYDFEEYIARDGKDGYSIEYYEYVTYANGEVEQNWIDTIITEPITEVIERGTMPSGNQDSDVSEGAGDEEPATVVRTYQDRVVTDIPQELVVEYSDELPKGKVEIREEGAPGERIRIYEVTEWSNGKEDRNLIDEEIVEPVTRFEVIGTNEEMDPGERVIDRTMQYEETPIPYNTIYKLNTDLEDNEEIVVQEGKDGLDIREFVVITYADGEIRRTLYYDETIPPVNEIIETGMRVYDY